MMSTHNLADSGSSRTLLTSWSIFSLLFTSCLSSGIVSRLTLTLYSPRVDSMQQLVEENYYWTAHDFAHTSQAKFDEIFSNFESPWFPMYMKKFKYVNNDGIRKKMESDKKITFFAHVYGDGLVVIKVDGLLGQKALRRFRLIKDSVAGLHVTFGVKKHSPYLQPLSKLTLRFIEAGLVKYWHDQVMSRWPQYDSKHLTVEHDDQAFSEPQPLRLNKTRPVFYLLLFGLGLGLVMFVIERSKSSGLVDNVIAESCRPFSWCIALLYFRVLPLHFSKHKNSTKQTLPNKN
ncbi:hypothetical protein J6590_015320 [Homalodisca vitripennis]|nr:hypothetical protein J6590_015320 [Homalodisca vitripennis]